jgi:hypothetical protein
MKILATHPGRYGDCLWALPTVRALSATFHTRVDLLVSPRVGTPGFLQLLRKQHAYLGTVIVAHDWEILETAPITPRVPPSLPSDYDLTVHLGYESWPQKALPYDIHRLAAPQVPDLAPINLATPWITTGLGLTCDVAVGFSDEYFEMKFGLERLLWEHLVLTDPEHPSRVVNVSGGPRWHQDLAWSTAAEWIAGAKLFVGCCSALHVLACAVGTPVVVVEPAPARHHDCFYPYGKQGPQVQLLLGADGLPTFDSRHLINAVDERLGLRQETPQETPA